MNLKNFWKLSDVQLSFYALSIEYLNSFSIGKLKVFSIEGMATRDVPILPAKFLEKYEGKSKEQNAGIIIIIIFQYCTTSNKKIMYRYIKSDCTL